MIEIKVKTLTPLWTGGVNGKCDRIHETGIIGSLRWWYEAIVRGLGGYACDPTNDDKNKRCELSGKEKTDEERRENICSVCYLFGCTGWSRKFKFELIREDEELCMRFISLRKIEPEEFTLLFRIIELISKYGSIGGKTIFKPSEVPEKNKKLHHQDFGLIKLLGIPDLDICSFNDIKHFVESFKQNKNHEEWPNLNNFWFVPGKDLNRESHNNIVNREKSHPSKYSPHATKLQKWLGGEQMKSKKIISFHTQAGKRTWGYTRNSKELNQVINMVIEETCWSRNDFKKGEDVLNELF